METTTAYRVCEVCFEDTDIPFRRRRKGETFMCPECRADTPPPMTAAEITESVARFKAQRAAKGF